MIITCPQVVEMVTSYKEGALGRWQRVQYRAHLLRCRHCRSYVRQVDATIDAARARARATDDATATPAEPVPEAPPALVERLRARRRP